MGWFRDGTKLIISGAVGPGDHEGDKSSLWVVSILGGAPRRLRGDAYGAVISPDDKLVTFYGGGKGIRIAGSDGENPREFLAATDDDHVNGPQWSWRGDRIVYKRFVRQGNREDRSIESRDLEGGSRTTLVSERQVGGLLLLEDPGGRSAGQTLMLEDRLVFVRGEPIPRHRDQNLWEIDVDAETGEAVGEPRRLTDWTDFSFSRLSATRDGRQLAFLNKRHQSDVYVGEIEGGSRSLGGIRRLSLDDLSDRPAAWTPDSQAVIYSSDRNGTADIFRQGLEQRTASVLVSSPRVMSDACLTPDRSSFLYWSVGASPDEGRGEADEPSRLLRIPVSGGPTEVILEAPEPWEIRCSRVQDGSCLLAEVDSESGRRDFYLLDPVQGQGHEVLSLELGRIRDVDPEWDLSPDGTKLSIVGDEAQDRSIRVVDLSGNLVEEIVLQGLPGNSITETAWPVSGRGFFFITTSARGAILGFLEPTGEAHVYLSEQSWNFDRLRPSPDGRFLAYERTTVDSNVWVIDNF